MPPLTCTSYKFRNNMAKNVRLTIFKKQRLHQQSLDGSRYQLMDVLDGELEGNPWRTTKGR